MTHLVSTLRGRLQQSFFVLLAGAVLIALVALPQTAFAAQGQEKAEVSPWSLVNEQGSSDKGHRTNGQTAFTYQGQLKDSSGPVNGSFDFQFTLYSAQTGGEQLGSIDIEDLALTNGLFSVQLDFGRAVLEAKEGWLEIGVRPGGSTEPYTVLFPRQKLTPTPYAIFAQHEQWSLIGVPVGFAGDRDKHTDMIGVDGKNVSAADVEASLAKLADKAVTGTTPDEGALPTAAMNPAACAQPVVCDSPDPNPAFSATNQNRMGTGIVGLGGVTGGYFQATASSGTRVGAYGVGGSAGLIGESTTTEPNNSGVHGRNFAPAPGGWGVFGFSQNGFAGVFGSGGNSGVFGLTGNGNASGVHGRNDGDNPLASWGVFGFSPKGFAGVFGSGGQNGVFGQTGNTTAAAAGVYGKNDGIGIGVFGQNRSTQAAAVLGRNDGGGDGVVGFSLGRGRGSGVFGFTDSPDGFGGFFTNTAGGVALHVDGRARAKVLEITGADLSEQFEVNGVMDSDSEASPEQVQPGLVVSIDPEAPGKLVISSQAYDHRVAGIISGAGDIKPGVLMNQSSSGPDGSHPVALTGRVYCWADASNGPIEPGDLLTTSNTPGHAMKVTNHKKAQGAIIGKAMTELKQGKGLVLVLVTLQ